FLSIEQGTEAVIEDVAVPTGVKHPDARFGAARPTFIALDTSGFFELMQSHRDAAHDGMRNIHFKVDDLDAAIESVQQLGVRLVGNVRIGGMREAIFQADDLYGVRLCLVEYTEPSLAEAIMV